MSSVVKSEASFECLSLYNNNCHVDNYGSLDKVPKARPQLFKFLLDILSNLCLFSIMSWEGTDGQFVIIRPDQVARLWGERNGRRNMTYEKFTRVLRYYYRKKVLTKIRGRKYTYKFNLRELETQYGYKCISFPATSESTVNSGYEIPATGALVSDVFPASPPMAMSMPHENQARPFGCFSHPTFPP